MIDFEGKTFALIFKMIILGCFGWLLRDSWKRPTREEMDSRIEDKIQSAKEVTNTKIDNIKEDVSEIKSDVKELMKK